MKPSDRSSAARLTEGAIEVCSSEVMTPESAEERAAADEPAADAAEETEEGE